MSDRDCESIPNLNKNPHFINHKSINYMFFYAVVNHFWEYFHSLDSVIRQAFEDDGLRYRLSILRFVED